MGTREEGKVSFNKRATSALGRLIVILGPTASGKTALSLSLALQLRSGQAKKECEIVSADSCQIYRGLNIGTAKTPRDTQNPDQSLFKLDAIASSLKSDYFSQNIRHHLVDIKNPDEDYNVSEFKKDATTAVEDITRRGKLPILVGGTAQYIYALVDNWQIPEVKDDPKLRQAIETMISEQGLDFVFQKLLALDPEAAYIVDPKNPRRVVRALEVAMLTGKPFTEQRRHGEPLFDSLLIGISPAPEVLKTRITERVKKMFTDGLVEEVKKLFSQYGKVKALDAIGYREVIAYLNNEITLAEAEQQIINNTIHFAKRQMTWFKRDQRIDWVQTLIEAEKLTERFLLLFSMLNF